nr:MAG TPA: hypothetical protein [Caudoviricetes sp.]
MVIRIGLPYRPFCDKILYFVCNAIDKHKMLWYNVV